MAKSGWTVLARRWLLAACGKQPGWGYRADTHPYVESTALVGLALLASSPTAAERAAIERAADWLEDQQHTDGSLGVAEHLSQPRWPTPWVMLLWAALNRTQAWERSAAWLAAVEGETLENTSNSVIAHDKTLPGWPWVVGTHSWTEPTAAAVLALADSNYQSRVHEGVAVLLDRALPRGGWNYGNTIVFGKEMRPQMGPSGLAILALAAKGRLSEPCVSRAVIWLQRALPGTRSPQALCWGLAALRQCGPLQESSKPPRSTQNWLQESFDKVDRRGRKPIHLAHLLLAAADLTNKLLVPSRPGTEL